MTAGFRLAQFVCAQNTTGYQGIEAMPPTQALPEIRTLAPRPLAPAPSPVLAARFGENSTLVDQLKHWVSLSGHTRDNNDRHFEDVTEMRELFGSCSRRLDVVEARYLSPLEDSDFKTQCTKDFSRLKDRLGQIQNELGQPGIFPDQIWLKAQNKRLRLLYNQLRDLALTIRDEEPISESPGPRKRRTSHAAPTRHTLGTPFQVGEVIEAVKNHPSRIAPGMGLRRYQEAATRAIVDEIKLSETDTEFARDDMVVGMVTGSGKTHVMKATIAAFIDKGWHRAGDKIIITTHLKEIKTQIRRSMQRELAEVFRNKFGREMKLSVYAGDEKDLSGDIVIVSLPTVFEREGTENPFYESLTARLGTAKLPLVMMDETHHEKAPQWQLFKQRINERFAQTKIVGFTGTPLPEQRERLVFTLGVHESLRLGITPETEIVMRKTGVMIDSLGKSPEDDFSNTKIASAINTPERNKAVLQILRDETLKTESGTPEPTLIFCADTKHIEALSQGYIKMFGDVEIQAGGRLKARYDSLRNNRHLTHKDALTELRKTYPVEPQMHLRQLVRVDNKTSSTEFDLLLRKRASGEIDGIVVTVNGNTPDWLMEKIHAVGQKGLIEVIFNCDKLGEGSDLYWMRNLVGARPSLSNIKRAQEIGRLFRYAPKDEIDFTTGTLLARNPRRLIDVRDQGPYAFVPYRDVAGLPFTTLEDGVRYNLVTQKPAGQIEADKEKKIRRKRGEKKRQDNEREDNEDADFVARGFEVSNILLQIGYNHYADDFARMAEDLGLDEDDLISKLTNPEGFYLTHAEIKEWEILFYLSSGSLLNLNFAKPHDDDDTTLAMAQAVLLDSLQFYLGLTDKPWHAQQISFTAGSDELEFSLKERSLRKLKQGQLGDLTLFNLAQALFYGLKAFTKEDAPVDPETRGLAIAAQRRIQETVNRAVVAAAKTPEEKRENTVLGQMAWDKTLQGIAEHTSGMTAAERGNFIKDWFFATHPGITEMPKEFIVTAGSGGVNNNKIAVGLSLLTHEEFVASGKAGKSDNSKIAVVWDEESQTLKLKGTDTANYSGKGKEKILGGLVTAGIVEESAAYWHIRFAELTAIEPENLKNHTADIKIILGHIARLSGKTEFILTAGAGGVQYNKISAGLSLLTHAEFAATGKVGNANYPKIAVVWDEESRTLKLKGSDAANYFGNGKEKILGGLVTAGIVEESAAYWHIRFAELTAIEPEYLKNHAAEIKIILGHIARLSGTTQFILTAGSGGVNNNKIAVGLSLLTHAEFAASGKAGKAANPKIAVVWDADSQTLRLNGTDTANYFGPGREKILGGLVSAGIVEESAAYWNIRLAELTAIEPENLKNHTANIKIILGHIARLSGTTQFILTAGSGGVALNKISAGLSLLTPTEFATSGKAGKANNPKIAVVWDEVSQTLKLKGTGKEYYSGTGKEKILGGLVTAGIVLDAKI